MRSTYYQRFKDWQQRFWDKVDKVSHAGGCWIWTAGRYNTGKIATGKSWTCAS